MNILILTMGNMGLLTLHLPVLQIRFSLSLHPLRKWLARVWHNNPREIFMHTRWIVISVFHDPLFRCEERLFQLVSFQLCLSFIKLYFINSSVMFCPWKCSVVRLSARILSKENFICNISFYLYFKGFGRLTNSFR